MQQGSRQADLPFADFVSVPNSTKDDGSQDNSPTSFDGDAHYWSSFFPFSSVHDAARIEVIRGSFTRIQQHQQSDIVTIELDQYNTWIIFNKM